MRRIEVEQGAYLHRRPNSSRWQLYAYVGGEEVKASTGKADQAEALEEARRMLAEARRRHEAGKRLRPPSFAEAAASWAAAELSADRPKDREARRALRDHLVPFFGAGGKRAVSEITDSDVRAYAKWRQERRQALLEALRRKALDRRAEAERRWRASEAIRRRHPVLADYLPRLSSGIVQQEVSATAFNQEMAALRAVFAHAVAAGMMLRSEVPAIANRPPSGSNARGGIGPEELEAVLACAHGRFEAAKAEAMEVAARRRSDPPEDAWTTDATAWGRFVLVNAVEVLAGTGMRPSSLCGVRRWHVREHLEGQTADWVQDRLARGLPLQCGYLLKVRTEKGRKPREWEVVPEEWCWPAVAALLAHAREPGDRLVPTNPPALNRGFKKVLRQLGLDTRPDGSFRSLYDLRHYAISAQLSDGVPPAIVADNTMTSLAMIDRHYKHLSPERHFRLLSKVGR